MSMKRIFSLLLAVVLVFCCTRSAVRAAEVKNKTNYNIVLVIDSSGSLEAEGGIRSDPDGIRFDAVNMFLDLLTESGNNVSAIVFKGNDSFTDDSDKKMRETCLRLNTPLEQIDSQEEKDALKRQICAVTAGGYTDIGTALLAAAEKLEGMTEKNGMESIIVLFTDGCTETGDSYHNQPQQPVYKKSLENRDEAVKRIREEGITLYGVFLNRNNASSSTELLEIVRDARTENSDASEDELGGLYQNVTTPGELVKTYQEFYSLISNTSVVRLEKTDSFRIPGSGVKDVNICLIATEADAISNTTVTLTPPHSPSMTGTQMLDIKSQGNTYAVYKITDPAYGVWDVQVNTAEGAGKVQCSLIVNMDIDARMETDVAAEDVRVNEPITIHANLFEDGRKLTDPSAYAEYECFLQLENADAGEDAQPTKISLSMDGSGAYTAEYMPLDYGVYYATAVFRCGDSVNIFSDSYLWKLVNHPPQAVDSEYVPISYGLDKEGWTEVDLTELVEDAEDDFAQLDILLDYGDYPEEAITRRDNILRVDGTIGGSGQVTIRFTDTRGAYDETVLDIAYAETAGDELRAIFGWIVLVIALAVMLWRELVAMKRVDGVFKFIIPLEDGTQQRETVTVDIWLSGLECMNKSLLKILTDRRDTIRIRAAETDQLRDDAANAVDEFLSNQHDALSGIWIRPAGYRSRECFIIHGTRRMKRTFGEKLNIDLSGGRKLHISFHEHEQS